MREAIAMLRANATVIQVANHFGVSRQCIYDMKTRMQVTGTVNGRPRSGRPRITNAAEDRHIRTMHIRDRFKSASQTSKEFRIGRRLSRNTVVRRLRVGGIVLKKPVQRILLRPRHCRAPLQWAQLHQRWIAGRWDNVIFSDECRFQMDIHDGRRSLQEGE